MSDVVFHDLPEMVAHGSIDRLAGIRPEIVCNPDGTVVSALQPHECAKFETHDGSKWQRIP